MLKSKIDKATGFEKRFENINTVVFENSGDASKEVAQEIAALIQSKQKENKPCILGLATGSSPKGLYAVLGVLLNPEKSLLAATLVIWSKATKRVFEF
jgi:glucosamine-6-phosphate deaminase